jgi:nitronate monooxygenase
MPSNSLPIIIQGGMGVAVSNWRLARAVSTQGQLGVVSGTALDLVLARRLQLGDRDGHLRRALAMFPFEEMANRILDRYFIAGGKSPDSAFNSISMLGDNPTQEQLELLVVANFVEVYLAKENHIGQIGVNYLEKIQLPTLPSLFGAMLAGVDYVLMGAGIPRHIPEVLDRLSEGSPVELPLNIEGAGGDDDFVIRFDPDQFTGSRVPWLARPRFLAIVASATLATMLTRKSKGRVDGFVVEGPTAGGHNASPRGPLKTNSRGEPIYGARDEVDLKTFRDLGLPFWLAGSYDTPEQVVEALQSGAAGVQIGTAFAFCEESGIGDEIKKEALRLSRDGETDVITDPVASPTGFPFKLLNLEGSMSEASVYQQRERVCDLGYLRHGYKKSNGTIGWRCPSDRVQLYVDKGGKAEDTVGRKCVCNGLSANIGLGQIRKATGEEKVMVTCGNRVNDIARFLSEPDATSYSAKQVIDYLVPSERLVNTGSAIPAGC